jgi:hypothetical protein
MSKQSQPHKKPQQPKSEEHLLLDFDEEYDDGLEEVDHDETDDWSISAPNFRRLQARRAVEAALDDLALRQALEDFPDERILN